MLGEPSLAVKTESAKKAHIIHERAELTRDKWGRLNIAAFVVEIDKTGKHQWHWQHCEKHGQCCKGGNGGEEEEDNSGYGAAADESRNGRRGGKQEEEEEAKIGWMERDSPSAFSLSLSLSP